MLSILIILKMNNKYTMNKKMTTYKNRTNNRSNFKYLIQNNEIINLLINILKKKKIENHLKLNMNKKLINKKDLLDLIHFKKLHLIDQNLNKKNQEYLQKKKKNTQKIHSLHMINNIL